MSHWDVVEVDGITIINAAWPQDRGVYWCEDPDTTSPYNIAGAFILADCEGDAVESLAEYNEHEGDDDNVTCRSVTAEERETVLRYVNAFLAAL